MSCAASLVFFLYVHCTGAFLCIEILILLLSIYHSIINKICLNQACFMYLILVFHRLDDNLNNFCIKVSGCLVDYL